MKKIIILLFVVLLSGCALQSRDEVYQYSTIGAFMQGAYDGHLRLADIRRQGDFGLGTFDGINGELVVLGGQFYQIKSDGLVYSVDEETLAPFAIVKFFNPDQKITIDQEMNLVGLGQFLDGVIGTKNVFFAFKIEGEFSYVKARSIDRQIKPYKPFPEVVQTQHIFEFNNVRGVLVGFYSPDYFPQVSPPRYHFHFITDDKKSGGHVVDLRIKNGTVLIDRASGFNLEFPKDKEFLSRNLNLDSGAYK